MTSLLNLFADLTEKKSSKFVLENLNQVVEGETQELLDAVHWLKQESNIVNTVEAFP